LIIEPFSQSKLNKIETENCIGILGVSLVLLESPWQVRFNRVCFTIFRAKVWKILIFERILLLEIQTNCKNWARKESVEPSMCSHLSQQHRLHLQIIKQFHEESICPRDGGKISWAKNHPTVIVDGS